MSKQVQAQVAALQLNLSPEDAAKALGISRSHLYKLLRAGSGPQFIKLGKLTLFPVSELERWVQSRLMAA